MALEHLRELHQGGMAVLPGYLAPLREHLHRPAGVVIVPDVGRQILEPVDGVESFVEGQELLQLHAALTFEVAPVLQKKVLATLEQLPEAAAGFAELLVADVVDHFVERLDHVEQIEDDVGLRTPSSSTAWRRNRQASSIEWSPAKPSKHRSI